MRTRSLATLLAALALAIPASPSSAAPQDCLAADPRFVPLCVARDAGNTAIDLVLGDHREEFEKFVACTFGSSC